MILIYNIILGFLYLTTLKDYFLKICYVLAVSIRYEKTNYINFTGLLHPIYKCRKVIYEYTTVAE